MLKKKGWSSPSLQTKKSGPPPRPVERQDRPLRHALRQEKMSMSQLTLGMRKELLSQELLGLSVSPHLP